MDKFRRESGGEGTFQYGFFAEGLLEHISKNLYQSRLIHSHINKHSIRSVARPSELISESPAIFLASPKALNRATRPYTHQHVSRQPLPCLLTPSKRLSSAARPDLNTTFKTPYITLTPAPETRLHLERDTRRSIAACKTATSTSYRRRRQCIIVRARGGDDHTSKPRVAAVMAGNEVLGRRAGLAQDADGQQAYAADMD